MASPAPCCTKALKDATTRWPNRNRQKDGIMGDAAHQLRKSDHNDGNAFDLTHDPDNGVDCQALSRQVINDARVTYVIWNRQIYERSKPKDGWQVQRGDPHLEHMHVSIHAASRDDLSQWPWSGVVYGPTLPVFPGVTLRQGSQGSNVRIVQQRLKNLGYVILVDGVFGRKTHDVVIAFQRKKNLLADGLVGRKTWAALWIN